MIINDCFKIRNLILAATLGIGLTLVNHATAQRRVLPDLVVTDLTGPTTIIHTRGVEIRIPIEFVVKNRSTTPAPSFETGIQYNYNSETPSVAPFNAFPEFGPRKLGPRILGAPEPPLMFKGTVRVPSRLNEVIFLRVIADYCPIPVRPKGCRVAESNETNNKSEPISTYICKPGPLPPSNLVQGISDLGPLPEGMPIAWPTPPSIPSRRDVIIDSGNFQDSYAGSDKSGTRFLFQDNIDEPVSVDASDVEIVIMPGFKLRNIELVGPVHRVKITGGGEVGRIRATMANTPETAIATNEDSGYITDVLIDGITLNNSQEDPLCETDGNDCDGVTFRGVRRGAVINSTISSLVYPMAAWNPLSTPPIAAQNKDIIIANNRLHSKGYTRDDSTPVSEATVRMHDSVNTVTVHNRLQNGSSDSAGGKHNYRIHGHPSKGGASYAYAACNLFVNTGAMIGEGGYDPAPPHEDVRHYWFNSNLFYQRADSLYQMGLTPDVAVHDAETRGNRAYSNLHTRFYSPDNRPADWIIRDNVVKRYGDDVRPPD
ncbi:hypothetical protein SAMN05216412_11166 [Nitrosospira multiformis]|uniref:Uncharacterized protein n=1 Tax=Nitrosospira multiformis TaxID=1231 RepID=A0A1I0G302_9PROT|nr:hypothetical protein [Nitrosospira multiformis]SET65209.1 hypothetical protein SAMN05216412_11166 [Nitrosospira multiformis]